MPHNKSLPELCMGSPQLNRSLLVRLCRQLLGLPFHRTPWHCLIVIVGTAMFSWLTDQVG